MKTNLYPVALFLIFNFSSCQKELSFEATEGVEIETAETKYLTLGTWDDWGKPSYLLTRDAISNNLLDFAMDNLPDKDLRTANPNLLNSAAVSDIRLTQQSDVFVTFVSQGSVSFGNALAFYTYATNRPPRSVSDVKTITYIFPQAGVRTPLEPGDKVKIGRFSAGTSLGFILLKDAWKFSIRNLDNTVGHFFSTDVLNPEEDSTLKKHVVAINYAAENKTLLGFEDVIRTAPECDHDFNDIVIYTTITP